MYIDLNFYFQGQKEALRMTFQKGCAELRQHDFISFQSIWPLMMMHKHYDNE